MNLKTIRDTFRNNAEMRVAYRGMVDPRYPGINVEREGSGCVARAAAMADKAGLTYEITGNRIEIQQGKSSLIVSDSGATNFADYGDVPNA